MAAADIINLVLVFLLVFVVAVDLSVHSRLRKNQRETVQIVAELVLDYSSRHLDDPTVQEQNTRRSLMSRATRLAQGVR